jgi:hypothetical protein
MEQMLERLLAKMDAIQHKMEADQREMKAEMMAKVDANLHKMEAKIDAMQATVDSHLGEMKAWRGKMKACRGVTHACLEEEEEPAPEETEAVAKPQKVPEGVTDEEPIGAAKDRSRDLHLAVGCRGQLKTRTKHDGGFRQEYADPSYRSCNAQGKTS